MIIRQLAIVGTGLIGGSFALALKQAGAEGRDDLLAWAPVLFGTDAVDDDKDN